MAQPWYQSFKPPVLVGAAVGAAVSAAMMYLAWKHDIDGDFQDETGVYWFNLFSAGILWFFVTSWPAAVIFGLVQISIGALCRRSNKPLQPTRAKESNNQRETSAGGPRG